MIEMATCQFCKQVLPKGGSSVVCDRCKNSNFLDVRSLKLPDSNRMNVSDQRKRRCLSVFKGELSLETKTPVRATAGEGGLLWTISDKLTKMDSNCGDRLRKIEEHISAMKTGQKFISNQYVDLTDEVKDFRDGNTVLHDEVKGLQRSLAAIDAEIIDLTIRLNDLHHTCVLDTASDQSTADIVKSIESESKVYHLLKQHKGVFLTMVLGLFALTFGSLLIVIDPYDIIFSMKVKISEGSESFESWETPPIKLVLKVYLFNVTNKDEYMSGKDSKLKFQQVGPYAYSEGMTHGNVSFNGNGTMTSVPLHPLKWLPELSNGTEEDLLILPNIALLSIANVMNDATFFTRVGLNLLIRQTNAEPLVRMTAKEFMFGYKSTLLSLGNKFMPSWIYFDKLGLIDRMYDFTGDTSTVYTGESDLRYGGLFENYNGLPYLPQWNGAPCNLVQHASDGAKFPSLVKPNDTLLFFRKSLCRSMPMVKVGEQYVSGMNGYVYNFRKSSLDNGHNETSNKCFCRKGNCLPSGLIDVTECYYGFPIALSYPHFMEGDPDLVDSVEGIHPDPKLHTTQFIINPESGLPLKLSVKMQINMALGDLSNIANSKLFSHFVMPMLWTDIYFDTLPTSLATKFYIYLTVGPIAQTVFTYLFLIGGVSFILLSLASAFCIPKEIKIGEPAANWKEDAFRHEVVEKELNKQRLKETTHNTKEMEVYYCSLLRSGNGDQSQEELEEDSVLQRTLDSLEEVEV